MASTDEDELIVSIPLSRRRYDKVAIARLNTSFDYSSRRGEEADVAPLGCTKCPLSNSSSALAISPTPTPSSPSSPSSEDSDDSWNLIPYNIPWGPDYVAYAAGTLPGPEGTCIFLRSPTPLKCQRTSQACKSCRERKAKCSGTRPSCERCLARGHSCQYTTSNKRNKRAGSGDKRRRMFSTTRRRHYDDVVTAVTTSVDPELNTLAQDDIPESSYLSTSFSLSPEAPCPTDDHVPVDNINEIDLCQCQFSGMPPDQLPISRVFSELESCSVYAPQPLRHSQTSSFLSVARVNDQFSCFIHPDPSNSSPSLQLGPSFVEFPSGYPTFYEFHDGLVQREDHRSNYNPSYPLQSDASYEVCVPGEYPYTYVDSRSGFGDDLQPICPSFGGEAMFSVDDTPSGISSHHGVVMNGFVE